VDDDPIADFEVGLLYPLFGALVSRHFRVEADFNGLSGRCFDSHRRAQNFNHGAGDVFCTV
jgi:hypothetical protein